MKHFISALAFTPLLIAAAPVPPEPPQAPRTVLIERVDARSEPGAQGRIVVEHRMGDAGAWTPEHAAVLAEAMESLREALSALPADIGTDLRIERHSGAFDEEGLRVRVEQARERAHAARARAGDAREAGRLARLHGERARITGLRAGASGMQAGLGAIDDALERGEVTRYGETRPMTAEERDELLGARERLQARLEAFREDHGALLDDEMGDGARVVVLRRGDSFGGASERRERTQSRRLRIEDRDGRLRVWVDGQELEGDALTGWLNSEEGQRVLRQRPEPPLAGGR